MRVDPVHAPRFAALLVEAYQQPVLFLTEVVVADRATDQRHAVARLGNRGDVLGHEILVLHRGDGVVHTHHRAHFIDAVAAGVHHDFAGDVALLCVHGPAIILVLGQADHRGIAIDFGASVTGTTRERLAQGRGVDVAIIAIPKPAKQVVGGNKRVTAGAFCGVDDFKLNAHAAGHRRKVTVAVHLRFGVGQTNTAITVAIADRVIHVVA